MRMQLFNDLLESVRQGGKIMRGEMKRRRKFRFGETDVRAIRERYKLS